MRLGDALLSLEVSACGSDESGAHILIGSMACYQAAQRNLAWKLSAPSSGGRVTITVAAEAPGAGEPIWLGLVNAPDGGQTASAGIPPEKQW